MRTMVQHCGHRMRGVREVRMRLIGRGIVIGLCALACFVALSLHAERVAAADYTVNVTTDTGTGSGAIGDLRYAINQVNNSTDPGNTITITVTGTITLTSALPYLSKNVAITGPGPGAAMLTVQAAAMPKTATYGVFTVTPSVTASIANLTIANGNSISDVTGSGILNQNGTLTVTNTTFAGNSAGNFNVGGGIYNDGTLTVTNSIFSGNSASSGGGIYNFRGTVMVTNSTFSGNSATSSGSRSGGGITNAGTLTLTNSTLSGNNASFGGGIDNVGTLAVTNSTLSDNNGGHDNGNGGGIYNNGMLTVTNSTLSGNSATSGAGGYGSGGGIYNFGAVTVTNSIFSGNSAPGRPTFAFGGGGIYNDFNGGTMTVTNSIFSGNSATDGIGGGIQNGGTLTVTNTTLSGNSAPDGEGGGIANSNGTLTVTNSTLSGNSALFGGGISNNSRLTVTNSTLSGNSAPNGTGGFSYGGGGIFNSGGTLNLTNTIVAGNTTAGTGPDISGAVTTTDHNLIGTIGGSTGITNNDAQGDIVNPMPNLGPLADNGGTTPLPDGTFVKTQVITNTSPAFHAGDPNVCTASFPTGANSQDERGANFPRSSTACSIGAFEPQSATTTITLSPTALPNSTVGVAYNQTISASGGSGTGFTFAITAGTLPSGLTLSSSGLLSGTPTAAGPFTFTVTATDSARNMGSQQYTLTITAPTITLTPTTLPAATVGVAYSQTLTAMGGTPPYTFAATGMLPTGLTLSTGGLLSGTPTAGGPFTFTVTATDTNGFTGTQQYTITVTVTAPTITLSPTTLPSGVKGGAYPATTLAAAGGTAPYTFAVTVGMLPPGLTLTPAGALSGTPSATGSFTFTVQATDANGFTGMHQYTITVSTTAPPTLKSIAFTGPGGTPPPATLKVGQNVAITATGTYSDGSTQNLSTQVQWSSSNAQVAMVDATGKVTGESPGTATISATLNGVTQTFTVTVGAPTPIGITVQPAPASRPSGVGITSPGTLAPAAAPVGR